MSEPAFAARVLTQWHRELAAGCRRRDTGDALYRAACRAAEALDWDRAGCPRAAAQAEADARVVLSTALGAEHRGAA
jgi:hypothetical protein